MKTSIELRLRYWHERYLLIMYERWRFAVYYRLAVMKYLIEGEFSVTGVNVSRKLDHVKSFIKRVILWDCGQNPVNRDAN